MTSLLWLVVVLVIMGVGYVRLTVSALMMTVDFDRSCTILPILSWVGSL